MLIMMQQLFSKHEFDFYIHPFSNSFLWFLSNNPNDNLGKMKDKTVEYVFTKLNSDLLISK